MGPQTPTYCSPKITTPPNLSTHSSPSCCSSATRSFSPTASIPKLPTHTTSFPTPTACIPTTTTGIPTTTTSIPTSTTISSSSSTTTSTAHSTSILSSRFCCPPLH